MLCACDFYFSSRTALLRPLPQSDPPPQPPHWNQDQDCYRRTGGPPQMIVRRIRLPEQPLARRTAAIAVETRASLLRRATM